MVKFLIHRPIAVTMAFLALLLIGIATSTSIPVSLMPDIDIPVISVQVSATEMPARQLENSVVSTIRSVLKEVNHVEEMKSETRDGSAWIELRFRHGTSIDLASVEVNEKVDKAMNRLPREIQRPEVIRASASDIPAFYLMVYQKNSSDLGKNGGLELSSFVSQVIRKRLEQLPEVALIDMSGLQFPEIKIVPDQAYLQNGAFSIAALEQLLNQNNIDLGNLLIHDGQYQYNIRFNTRLRDISDIQKIPVNLNGKVVNLEEIADISLLPQVQSGNVRFNQNEAVSLAVIKQSDAKMADLKTQLDFLIEKFKSDYPDLEFSVVRDQTKLLSYSIKNLGQSLLFGGLLAFLAMFLFLRERKAPWLIGISIPVSLIISMLFFYLVGLSINIISLSGLVLGVGMMIDNSIIVIDNITQYRQRHTALDKACYEGTNEIIRPLISSVLTTCAVFIPLIFMKGMAGALFFDQAVAVSIGLGVSLIVSITLLPTLYRIFYRRNEDVAKKTIYPFYFNWYEKGLKFIFRNQLGTLLLVAGMIAAAVVLYRVMVISRFPEVSQDEAVLQIDWNEPVTLQENNNRVEEILSALSEAPEYVIEEAGKQQYLLNSTEESGTSENHLYLKTASPARLSKLKNEVAVYMDKNYPDGDFTFAETDNLFNLAFGKTGEPLIAQFSSKRPGSEDYLPGLTLLQQKTETEFPGKVESKLVTRKLILLETDPEKLLFYNVDNNDLYRQIKSAFNVNTVFIINDNNMFIPVSIGNNYSSVYQIISSINVKNDKREEIPLSGLVKVSSGTDLKSIVAGKDGEYFPVKLNIDAKEYRKSVAQIKKIAGEDNQFDVTFSGSIISNRGMLRELIVIISVSLLLLYFILAAQFESFVLPVIVLLGSPYRPVWRIFVFTTFW